MAKDKKHPTPDPESSSDESNKDGGMPWGWLDMPSAGEASSDEPRLGSSFGVIEDHSETGSFDELLLPVENPPAPSGSPRKKKSAPAKGLLITVSALVAVAALGFFGFMAWDGYQETQKVEQIHQEEQQQEREKAQAIREAENPFSVLVGKVDPPSEDPLDVTVAEDQLKVGASTLSIRGGTLAATVNGCSLGAITDICLGARGKLGEGDFDVILVKDVSRTRLLDDPSEFSEFKTSGKTVAASLAIDMGSEEGPARMGVLTANGTTGFVLIFPNGTSASRVEEVLKAATVI